jgi:hypothetical protein
LSSEEQFLDIVYLGVFVILSPAFDHRFYSKPPPSLLAEAAYAVRSFETLMHIFSLRFVIFLQGTAVAPAYVVNRMLAEFAAAAVVFARRLDRPLGEGNDSGRVKILFPQFLRQIEGILEDSIPDVMPFFSSRAEAHKDFVWTGPELLILPRRKDVIDLIECTGTGELLDWPGCPIYQQEIKDTSSTPMPPNHKRNLSEEGMDSERLKKRRH